MRRLLMTPKDAVDELVNNYDTLTSSMFCAIPITENDDNYVLGAYLILNNIFDLYWIVSSKFEKVGTVSVTDFLYNKHSNTGIFDYGYCDEIDFILSDVAGVKRIAAASNIKIPKYDKNVAIPIWLADVINFHRKAISQGYGIEDSVFKAISIELGKLFY